MIGKLLLPAVALAMAGYAVVYVVNGHPSSAPHRSPASPVESPFEQAVCGIGVIEPESEDIAVSAPFPGMVVEVAAAVNQEVRSGDALFRLDDRELRARLTVREAALAVARRGLSRLDQLPRTEELPSRQEKVRECRAQVEFQKDLLKRVSDLLDRNAVSQSEFESARRSVRVAEAQLATAVAEYALLEAGAWQPDRELAQSQIELAEAELAHVQSEIERSTIRAPIDGRVLQVNVRAGEYAATPSAAPLVVIGRTDRLRVRVEIDDRDIDRLRTDGKATAFVRSRTRRAFPLSFVRVEPHLIAKRFLTADARQQTDTRVLQVIYECQPGTSDLYVGQEVDVFIEARE